MKHNFRKTIGIITLLLKRIFIEYNVCPYCGKLLDKRLRWQKIKKPEVCTCKVYLNNNGNITIDALGDTNDRVKRKKK